MPGGFVLKCFDDRPPTKELELNWSDHSGATVGRPLILVIIPLTLLIAITKIPEGVVVGSEILLGLLTHKNIKIPIKKSHNLN